MLADLPFAKIDLEHLFRECTENYFNVGNVMLPFPDNSRVDTSWPLSSDSVAL